jgi:hypothetical protein
MTATLTINEQIEHDAHAEVAKLAKFAPVIAVAKAYFFSHKDSMVGLSLNSVYLAFNHVQRERSVERVIFTCKRRACKHVWAHEYTGKAGDSLYRIVDGEKQWMADDYQCPECGNSLYIESNLVVGTYNEKHVCNARCMSATSGVCSCSCGGKQHGMNHL